MHSYTDPQNFYVNQINLITYRRIHNTKRHTTSSAHTNMLNYAKRFEMTSISPYSRYTYIHDIRFILVCIDQKSHSDRYRKVEKKAFRSCDDFMEKSEATTMWNLDVAKETMCECVLWMFPCFSFPFHARYKIHIFAWKLGTTIIIKLANVRRYNVRSKETAKDGDEYCSIRKWGT